MPQIGHVEQLPHQGHCRTLIVGFTISFDRFFAVGWFPAWPISRRTILKLPLEGLPGEVILQDPFGEHSTCRMGRDASDHGHWFLLLNGDPGRHAPPHADPADAEALVPLPAKPLHQGAPLFDRCAPHGPQVAEAVQHLLVLVRRTATPVVWIFQDQRTDPVSEQRNGQGPAAPGKPLVAGRREMEADRSFP